MASETSKCRDRLKIYCYGMGLDLGFGGDPITQRAITVDLPSPYTIVGHAVQNLTGDARWLVWFNDNVLDFVFSSHLLEDFSRPELPLILKEWLRVIKPGGHLVLCCPDQQRYLAWCKQNKTIPNGSHKIPDFSLKLLLLIVADHLGTLCTVAKATDNPAEYSFDLVLLKN